MSKGLKVLQEIKSKPFSWEKLKDSLDIIEKELKALEIIRDKECLFKGLSETTQEEFDLLMEALK